MAVIGVVLGEVAEGEGPGVRVVGAGASIADHLRGDLDAVGEQAHGHGLGARPVLVAAVVPDLGALDLDLLGVRVDNRHLLGLAGDGGDRAVRSLAVDDVRGLVAVQGILDNAVGELDALLAGGEDGEAGEGRGPPVALAQRHGGAGDVSPGPAVVRGGLDPYGRGLRGGADPPLGDLDRRRVGRAGVGNGVAD